MLALGGYLVRGGGGGVLEDGRENFIEVNPQPTGNMWVERASAFAEEFIYAAVS